MKANKDNQGSEKCRQTKSSYVVLSESIMRYFSKGTMTQTAQSDISELEDLEMIQ